EVKKEINETETKVSIKTNGKTDPKKPKKEPKTETPKKRGKNNVKEEKIDEKNEDGEVSEDDSSKWWLRLGEEDKGIKWTSLSHNGPMFEPPYTPHGIKMKYDGKAISLEPEAEEVATFWAELVNTDHAKKEVFRNNFFADFLKVCKAQNTDCPIKTFDKCDFSPIVDYVQELREKKKAMTKAEKEVAKQERKALEDKYGWAYLDGRKEKIGTYRIEPPGLFRGRGDHPKTGMLKTRVYPEQITINISEDASVPEAPAGHKWNEVIHDNTVTWLATWKENVNGNTKYVFLAADSSLKGKSDFEKFAKAQELKKCVGKIRKEYTANLTDKDTQIRQRATALYLIDRYALRAGNEKGEDEADTVGCCSLRLEHITLEEGNKVIFDFLGKDSIRYYNEVTVDEQVFKNLKIFKKPPKVDSDAIFDRITTTSLNSHLNSLMKGLSAKVFRTYNASFTFQEELKKTPENATDKEKLLAYNRANRRVAEICNHQRTVPKTHGDQMLRIGDKIRGYKVKRKEFKEQILKLDPKLRKSRPELIEIESDIDDDFIERFEEEVLQKEKEAKEKKLLKINEKRREAGEKELKSIDELPEPKKVALTLERLEKQLIKINETIKNQKLSLLDK
ncbi:DNA topoisomerase 1, partial [Nowakowskiella sp. JEL0078]